MLEVGGGGMRRVRVVSGKETLLVLRGFYL